MSAATEVELVYRTGFMAHAPDRPHWVVIGALGAVELWSFGGRMIPGNPGWEGYYLGGCEYHARQEPEYAWHPEASYESCDVLNGAPCWHDGSSLVDDLLARALAGDDMRATLAARYRSYEWVKTDGAS